MHVIFDVYWFILQLPELLHRVNSKEIEGNTVNPVLSSVFTLWPNYEVQLLINVESCRCNSLKPADMVKSFSCCLAKYKNVERVRSK